MKKTPERARGRRGAMFTIMVLVTSTILLAVGGALVDSTRNLTKHAGLADQQEVAKQALAGASEWARAEVATWGGEKRAAAATLHLARATVVVKLAPTEGGVAVEAVATVKPDVRLASSALLAFRDGRWAIRSFVIKASP